MVLLDTDKDGTLDIEEVKASAAAEFERLINSNPEMTLMPEKAREHLRRKYIALILKWFALADLKKDGRLDEDELASPAGRKLARLLTTMVTARAQPAQQPPQP